MRATSVTTKIDWFTCLSAIKGIIENANAEDKERFCEQDALELEAAALAIRKMIGKELPSNWVIPNTTPLPNATYMGWCTLHGHYYGSVLCPKCNTTPVIYGGTVPVSGTVAVPAAGAGFTVSLEGTCCPTKSRQDECPAEFRNDATGYVDLDEWQQP